MSNLGKRVEQLEQQLGCVADAVRCIFLVGLRPDGVERDDSRVVGYAGAAREWARQDGETVEALRGRVLADCVTAGVVALVAERTRPAA